MYSSSDVTHTPPEYNQFNPYPIAPTDDDNKFFACSRLIDFAQRVSDVDKIQIVKAIDKFAASASLRKVAQHKDLADLYLVIDRCQITLGDYPGASANTLVRDVCVIVKNSSRFVKRGKTRSHQFVRRCILPPGDDAAYNELVRDLDRRLLENFYNPNRDRRLLLYFAACIDKIDLGVVPHRHANLVLDRFLTKAHFPHRIDPAITRAMADSVSRMPFTNIEAIRLLRDRVNAGIFGKNVRVVNGLLALADVHEQRLLGQQRSQGNQDAILAA